MGGTTEMRLFGIKGSTKGEKRTTARFSDPSSTAESAECRAARPVAAHEDTGIRGRAIHVSPMKLNVTERCFSDFFEEHVGTVSRVFLDTSAPSKSSCEFEELFLTGIAVFEGDDDALSACQQLDGWDNAELTCLGEKMKVK